MPIVGEHACPPAPALADGTLPNAVEELVHALQPALRRGGPAQFPLPRIHRGSWCWRGVCRLSGRSARPAVRDCITSVLFADSDPRPHLLCLPLDRLRRLGGSHAPALLLVEGFLHSAALRGVREFRLSPVDPLVPAAGLSKVPHGLSAVGKGGAWRTKRIGGWDTTPLQEAAPRGGGPLPVLRTGTASWDDRLLSWACSWWVLSFPRRHKVTR